MSSAPWVRIGFEIEGLHKIVVGTRVQPLDPIQHLVERGQNDDWGHVAPRAQALEEGDAAPIRQHEVEQDKVVGG